MLYDLSNPLQRESFRTKSEALFNKECIVELTEKKSRRTNQQNAYLHVALSYFASEVGETMEYVKKNYFKILCNKDLFVQDTEDKYLGKIKTLRSSADLTTDEMTTAIERWRNWAASEGIYIPAPDEQKLVQLMEIEVSRYKYYV